MAARAAAQPFTGAGARMAAWRAHAYCADAAAALRLDAARRPVRRAPRELLIRVHATSINPIDLAMIRGYGARVLNAWRALEGGEGVEFPLTPGRDFVGTVAGAAPGAALAPGARVWGVLPPHRAGAHAQYVLAEEDWVSPAPTTLDDLHAGGALYGALTACAALRAAALAPGAARGRRALVLGLGAVGHAAAQLLRDDHHVVVSCSGEQADEVRALGAEPLDRHREDYATRLRDAGSFDAVFDCAGLGGAGAARLPCPFGVYVTLSSPLLRRADAHGLLPGVAAAAADLLRDNLAVSRPGQRALDTINTWCRENELSVNADKTVVVPFTNKRKLDNLRPLSLNGKTIPFSSEVKYLGVTLDQKLTWNPHVNGILQKAKVALAICCRLAGNRWGLKPKIALWLYRSIVRPMVSYASVAWYRKTTQKTTIAKLSGLQRTACIIVTGAMSTSPTA